MNRKTALLNAIERTHEQLLAFADSLSDEDRAATGTLENWSGKDLLAHCAMWIDMNARRLQGEEIPQFNDFHALNDKMYGEWQQRPWANVAALLAASHDALIAAVSALEPDVLEAPANLGGTDDPAEWRQLAGTACLHPLVHLGEHFVQRKRPQKASALYAALMESLAPIDDSDHWRGMLAYNHACSLALTGYKAEAISLLAQALSLNPDLRDWSQQDSDLDSLRGEAAYQALFVE